VKILIDMNLSPEWVSFLEQAGFMCAHWSTVGNPRAPDSELMAWAREHGYVVFTHDLDFGALLETVSNISSSSLNLNHSHRFRPPTRLTQLRPTRSPRAS
jgi:predicted nuclease of predicted toxin-antitoxin system